MNNPTLLKANVTKEQAIETMDYLYCERIGYTSYYKDETISWFDKNDNHIAKWTKEYKNLMISKDFVDKH